MDTATFHLLIVLFAAIGIVLLALILVLTYLSYKEAKEINREIREDGL